MSNCRWRCRWMVCKAVDAAGAWHQLLCAHPFEMMQQRRLSSYAKAKGCATTSLIIMEKPPTSQTRKRAIQHGACVCVCVCSTERSVTVENYVNGVCDHGARADATDRCLWHHRAPLRQWRHRRPSRQRCNCSPDVWWLSTTKLLTSRCGRLLVAPNTRHVRSPVERAMPALK